MPPTAISQAPGFVGRPTRRVDGPLKVTGRAKYAAEYDAPGLAYGYIVSSAVAAGRVLAIEADAALQMPGVIRIFSHADRPATATADKAWQDEVAPPGHPFRPFGSDEIHFALQPIALVVAETYEAARDAASLVTARYEVTQHRVDLKRERATAYDPPEKRAGIPPPPAPRGDFAQAYADAPVKISADYVLAPEYHNPMEMFGTTVVRNDDGKLLVFDKTQGSQNVKAYLAGVFGLPEGDIRVVNAYVGGAFGTALRPNMSAVLAVMASLALERSVRVTLTREQMFALGYRPHMEQTVSLACGRDGKLLAVHHDAVSGTSPFEDYQEAVVNWSGMLYACANTKLSYALAKLNTNTPCDMRAPGATSGVYALEAAMDELAHAAGIDPLELRIRNFSERDGNTDKPYSSKALMLCYREGAARFGWSRRQLAPRSMREGNELVGFGMATGVWEAMVVPVTAKAILSADGALEVSTASSDIGTGTYTILAQIAADAFGLPLERVTVRIGDSALSAHPVEGGSWTAASAGASVSLACAKLKEQALARARRMTNSPLAQAAMEEVAFTDGRIALAGDAGRGVSLADVLRASDLGHLEEEASFTPDEKLAGRYASYSHAAVFAEVRVDEELGVLRVPRLVSAVAGGKILNPKTARSQILGGVVMGLGMALHEEGLFDHDLGRLMNHNYAEYHVPVNADIGDIDVLFVDEHEDKLGHLGVKGLGEIGIVGTAAAVANAIFHATGKRVRDLPITLDKLLG
ncbi:xanthine dehydrogenase family protein molybdopterin-binding subunit [Chelatococcus reniformis]|nr:xanthine dehydrogenase family protein molybdopterin-binding subunit [Chelatococcus reniformis]